MTILGRFDEHKPAGIIEFPDEHYFEFNISGSTKQYRGEKLQPLHKALYYSALANNKEDIKKLEEWPFGRHTTNIIIKLIPEPDNKYDSNAILVSAEFYEDMDTPDRLNRFKQPYKQLILGYVPRLINTRVLDNFHRIKIGNIKKVRYMFNKYYNTKVAIPWKDEDNREKFHLRRAIEVVE